MGPAPWRGICAEDAVVEILMGGNERQAIDKALAKFDKRFLIGTEATTKERELIEPMVQLARDGQLMAYKHEDFWQCMDTLRDKRLLQELWDANNAPWKH